MNLIFNQINFIKFMVNHTILREILYKVIPCKRLIKYKALKESTHSNNSRLKNLEKF